MTAWRELYDNDIEPNAYLGQERPQGSLYFLSIVDFFIKNIYTLPYFELACNRVKIG